MSKLSEEDFVNYLNGRFCINNMQIELSKDISKKLENASKILGIKDRVLIDRAVLVYLDSIQKQINLKQEMKLWDELSDEALINFEKSL